MTRMHLQAFVRAKFASLADKGYFHTIGVLVAVQGLGLLLRIVLGRLLSLEEFGRFSLLIESVNFAAFMVTLGLPNAMMWYGVREHRQEYHLSGALRILAVYSVLALLIYAVARQWWQVYDDPVVTRLLDWFIVLAAPFALFNYIAMFLTASKRGKERAWIIFVLRLFFFASVTTGTLIYSWEGTIGGYLLFLLLFPAFLVVRFRRSIFQRIPHYPYRALLSYSGWDSVGLTFMAVAQLLIFIFSERLLDDVRVVSQLAIAVSFSVLARYAFSAVRDIFFPYFMEKTSRRELLILLTKVLSFYGLLVVAVVTVSYLIVPTLIPLLLGDRFTPSVPIFKILVLGEIIVAFSSLLELLHQMLRTLKIKAFGLTVSLAVYAYLLMTMIPQRGLEGAAMAFVLFAVARTLLMAAGVTYALATTKMYQQPDARLGIDPADTSAP